MGTWIFSAEISKGIPASNHREQILHRLTESAEHEVTLKRAGKELLSYR
jgi:hypothetical protein